MGLNERYIIAFKGLAAGSYDYDFRVDGELFRAYENAEISDGAADVHVRMERAESMLTLDVQIRGEVVVPCDRCLEDCRLPIDYTGTLRVRFSDEPGEYDGEVLWLNPAEEAVDLTQYLYESMVLALPYRRVHPEGECDPEMLKRFRIVSEGEFAEIEARAEEPTETLDEEQLAQLASLKAQFEGTEGAEGTGKK